MSDATRTEPVLSVEHLSVTFPTDNGPLRAVDDVSFTVAAGETLAIVGESGSGKTATAMAILGLMPRRRNVSGQVHFDGRDLLDLSESELESVRGKHIAMVFQDSLAALNPVQRVGNQIAEAITVHESIGRAEVRARVIELMGLVGLADPSRQVDQYPHELSGGMRQRAMVAMAIANDPAVLIADEPTTALDVTIQAQVLDVFERIQARTDTAIVLITHDLGVVAGMADRVMVMYAGRAVERAGVDDLFYRTRHPYTAGLLAAVPRLDRGVGQAGRLQAIAGQPPSPLALPPGCAFHPRCPYARLDDRCADAVPPLRPIAAGHDVACHHAEEIAAASPAPTSPGVHEAGVHEAGAHEPDADEPAARSPDHGREPVTGEPLLEVRDLVRQFPVRAGLFRRATGVVQAVSGVSFSLRRGETLGIVGESGCGKSTTGRAVLRLIEPTSGSVRFDGIDVTAADRRELRRLRARIQIVFQDPYASLDPRMTAAAIVAEPMRIHRIYGAGGTARVAELLSLVGLEPDDGSRFPHEFSGGQRQRIGIARALALEPDLLVLDEPVSALDVSIQAGVVNLLEDLQATLGIAYLFIGHDLAVVRHICDDVAVMYLGRLVETGPADAVYTQAGHPYTQALLSAVPIPDPRREAQRSRIMLEGDVPHATDPPTGCRFRTRCWKAQDVCAEIDPELVDRGQGHPVACHFAETREDM